MMRLWVRLALLWIVLTALALKLMVISLLPDRPQKPKEC